MLQLQLEGTSTCNAKCVFCPYPSAGRWGGLMPMSLFRKIIDEAATIPLIEHICITGLGEPTLDPHLVERVKYARKQKPKVIIDLYTNGTFMYADLFEELKAAGLDYMSFSLNATTPEQHESQMGLKDKFEIVCGNIDYAIAHRGMMQVIVKAVVAKDFWSREDAERFNTRWGARAIGGFGQMVYEGNWADSGRTSREFKPNEACGRALEQIYVLHDGRVTTCCFDPTGAQVFGDLSKQTIREVYSSDRYIRFREDHFNNEADKYEMCRGCTRI